MHERSSPSHLSCPEAPTPPDQGDISGQSTRFSTTNTALRAVKEAGSTMNRTLTSLDSEVSPQSQRAQFSIAFILPGSTHAAGSDQGEISGQSTRFSTTNTALRAVKEAEEHDESMVDFIRLCVKSPVTASAVLHCVHLTWKHPRRRIEVSFQISRPTFLPRTRPCVR